MRKVKRSDVKRPAALFGEKSKGVQECVEAKNFFAKKSNKQKSFEFDAYKDKSVKRALKELFKAKCAYCEVHYAKMAPVDIEHYRPKSAVVVKGKMRKPGYYWLACEWSNLLPSCIDCNREREQEFPNGPRKAGKANLFPIANEDEYATKPGAEKKEKRLLLDPCRDNPESHLEFLVPIPKSENDVLARDKLGLIRPRRDSRGRASRKGKESIEVFGLDRLELVRARRDRLTTVLAHIQTITDLRLEIEEKGRTERLMSLLERTIKDLKGMAEDTKEYVTSTRAAIKEHLGVI